MLYATGMKENDMDKAQVQNYASAAGDKLLFCSCCSM